MQSTFLTTLTFFLALFNFALAKEAAPIAGAILTSRQTTAGTTDVCLDYQITATHAVIGANTTYRAAYYSLSKVGTMYDARMLDSAIAKLPKLTADAALNTQCGNWTAQALENAATNFTQGIVGPFSGVQPLVLTSGPIVAVIVGACCIIFGATWILMP